ncbi:DUF1294 domain-containing protein [Halobacillus shinanisalinarum]|uniref:DUF1294 domain-containing protein n=1 Tax=Halobacillus shinanisalinarum TaxID=2932258 RepID=UPI00296256DD|nr:DUF1294 domain-containing protein [Halobacillus shinanisalinarum]
MEVIVYVVLGINLFCSIVLFFLVGSDKRKARKGQWRVKEKHLWLFALLGGAIGGQRACTLSDIRQNRPASDSVGPR